MTVILVDHMGSDLTIVNAARGSFGKKSDWIITESIDEKGNVARFRELSEKDLGLLRSLVNNRHTVPFEHVTFHFHVTCSIAVAREWFRHRIASYSEASTRYRQINKDTYNFYIPKDDKIRKQIGTAMQYKMVPITDEILIENILTIMWNSYNAAFDAYSDLIRNGLAREVARNVLPLGMETEFYWTANLGSIFNFLSLRDEEHALLEIQEEAREVAELVSTVVPEAYKAFVDNGKRLK